MGRSEDNISSLKTPTIHVPAQLGSFTLPAGHPQRQNISSALVSAQLRRDTASRFSENILHGPPPRYYAQSQSREVLVRPGAVGGSSAHSAARVGSTARFPGSISNRNFLIEGSMQPPHDTAFHSSVMVVPSYTTNATTQSYESHAIHTLQLQHATSPSGIGASAGSLANARYRLEIGSFTQVSGGIPHINSMLANPVSLQPDPVSRPFSGNPSYGSKAPIYEGDVRYVSQSHIAKSSRFTVPRDPAYHSPDHSPYGQASPHTPSPLLLPTQTSRTETSHPNAHQPTPFAEHAAQAVSFSEHGAQQSGSSGVFHDNGCFIDEDDLTDQGTNDIITIGECLRSDSPCGLWVKTNKGSLKRHAQKWHGVTRGDDTSIVKCTWAECNTTMQKGAVPRHTLCKHFGETFQCNGCSSSFTRDYIWRSHAAKCTLSYVGHSVTYIPSIRTIDLKGISLNKSVTNAG